MVAGIVEHLANQASALADVLVHDGGRNDLQEVGVELNIIWGKQNNFKLSDEGFIQVINGPGSFTNFKS